MFLKRILVVEDDELMREFLTGILKEEGYTVSESKDPKEATELIKREDFELIISDVKMPYMSGIELMTEISKIKPSIKWIFLTAYGTIPEAIDAVKRGAVDYLSKPLESPEALRQLVKRVFSDIDRDRHLEVISEELLKGRPPMELLFAGAEMQAVKDLVLNVADTQTTVLITGPSGTGKELVAWTIHHLSSRAKQPFVAVHCAALSESVLESELFGHEKGAFTGAIHQRKGRFELARGGTVFLDEIGEISPAVQVKLLRVLQERVIERVGGNTPIPIDVRVLAATNKDLRQEVAKGNFREDLFYRLHVFPIELPPLKRRKDALRELTDYFIKKHSVAIGKKGCTISEEAMAVLLEYDWPGNIRELQNVIERAVILCSGVIEPAHLNIPKVTPTVNNKKTSQTLDDLEREAIIETLHKTDGNKKRAAELLGISRRTLHYKLKSFGLK